MTHVCRACGHTQDEFCKWIACYGLCPACFKDAKKRVYKERREKITALFREEGVKHLPSTSTFQYSHGGSRYIGSRRERFVLERDWVEKFIGEPIRSLQFEALVYDMDDLRPHIYGPSGVVLSMIGDHIHWLYDRLAAKIRERTGLDYLAPDMARGGEAVS